MGWGWLHVFQMKQSESNFTLAGASSMQEGLCFLTCKIQLWVSDETLSAQQKDQSILKHVRRTNTSSFLSTP